MAQLAGITLSLILSEDENRSGSISEKPVEKGTAVTDHVVRDPIIIDIVCVLTQGAEKTRERICALWESSERVTYKGENTYHNVVVTHVGSLSQVDNKGGYTLEIRLSQPRVAKLKTYRVRAKNPVTKTQDGKTSTRVNQQLNKGTQAKEEVYNKNEKTKFNNPIYQQIIKRPFGPPPPPKLPGAPKVVKVFAERLEKQFTTFVEPYGETLGKPHTKTQSGGDSAW